MRRAALGLVSLDFAMGPRASSFSGSEGPHLWANEDIISVVLPLVLGVRRAHERKGGNVVQEQTACEGEEAPGCESSTEMLAWRSQGGLRGELEQG